MEASAAIISPIVESVRPLISPEVLEGISPQFFVTFWSLSMYDLPVPVDSIQKEIQKIEQQSVSVVSTKFNSESELFFAMKESDFKFSHFFDLTECERMEGTRTVHNVD